MDRTELLDFVFHHSPSALAVLTGEDLVYEMANEAYYEQVGNRQLVGKPLFEALPEASGQGFEERLAGVVRTGVPYVGRELPVTLRRSADAPPQLRYINRTYLPLRDAQGGTVGIVVHGTDVTDHVVARMTLETERVRLSDALEAAPSDLLRSVFAQAPAFLAILRGPDHVFELVNEAYYRVVGYRDLIGKPVFEALPEMKNQGFGELLDAVLATGVPWTGREIPAMVTPGRGETPKEVFLDFTYLPLVDANGVRTGVIAHGTDVTAHVETRRIVENLLAESNTARQELEAANAQLGSQQTELELSNLQLQESASELEQQAAELQQQAEELQATGMELEQRTLDAEAAQARAEEANSVKARFLATMSHELRTPLNAVAGYSDLLLIGVHGELSQDQRDYVQRIKRSGQHLLSLINDVLNFAKLDAGRVEYRLTDTPIGDLVCTLEDMIGPQLAAKRLSFSCTRTTLDIALHVDAEKVQQVLLNLLTNAIKFTGEGGRIEVTNDVDADFAYIKVRDSGVGIAPDHVGRIFDPFVQVDRGLARGRQEGVGLGLTISRDLARGMGGDLTVESKPGVGSTFTLKLPRARGKAE